MSLNNVPSREEVMGWYPQSLADYMRGLRLSGCGTVVKRGSITGAQFMQMTENDLQIFPSLYVSTITKIQRDINKEEQRTVSGYKSKAQKYPKQAFVQEENIWNMDEFDSGSDYESLHQQEEEGPYMSALTEPPMYGQEDSEDTTDEEYELLPSADTMKPPRHSSVAVQAEHHYRDPVNDPSTAESTSKTLRMNHGFATLFKRSARQFKELPVDSSKEFGQTGPSQKDSKGSAAEAPGSSTSKPQSKSSRPIDVSERASKRIAAPTKPAMVNNSIPGTRGESIQGLDPSWYGGKVTRHQAEVALREVNKDGAFVVRDSSNGSVEHPYTLMLLKQGKVYNIKIRSQDNAFSLGTSINTKIFSGVKEMITHHTHTPLLLRDVTDQRSEAQSQCCLLHPVGL